MVEPDETDLLRRIERQAIETATQGREVVPVGPFTALLNPTTDLIWLNYAVPTVPIPGGADTDAVMGDLRAVFRERGRTPRFEFIGELWPDLAPLLERWGMALESRDPLMLCTPEDLDPVRAPGVSVHVLSDADDDRTLTTFVDVQSRGFGLADQGPTPERIRNLRANLRLKQVRCGLALLDGEAAGVASLTPVQAIGELVAVATLPEKRRRGVAATISSRLTADHFGSGGTLVWLSAGDSTAEATYRRIGYRTIATRLNYSDAGS